MKAMLISIIGILFFASLGGQVIESQAVTSEPVPSARPITNRNELNGTWYSFPVGVMLRFNDDGSMDFGLDEEGNELGYKAETWLEGSRLHIRFTNHPDSSETCATAVGIYDILARESGGITFVPVQDDCLMRSNLLNGHPDLGFDLAFQPMN